MCMRKPKHSTNTQDPDSFLINLLFVLLCIMTCSSSLPLSWMSSSSFIFSYLRLHLLNAKGLMHPNTMQFLCQVQFQTVHEDNAEKNIHSTFDCFSTGVSVLDGMLDNTHILRRKCGCAAFFYSSCMHHLLGSKGAWLRQSQLVLRLYQICNNVEQLALIKWACQKYTVPMV